MILWAVTQGLVFRWVSVYPLSSAKLQLRFIEGTTYPAPARLINLQRFFQSVLGVKIFMSLLAMAGTFIKGVVGINKKTAQDLSRVQDQSFVLVCELFLSSCFILDGCEGCSRLEHVINIPLTSLDKK